MDYHKFLEIFNDSELSGSKVIIKSRLREVIKFVKNDYSYDILKEIIGVHKQDGMVELIYHLFSVKDEEDLFVSISVYDEVETLSDIYPSAIADENEIYDLFGIKFLGNNNLKRLYLPDAWQGYPLRKDYVHDDMRLCWNEQDNA